MIRYAVAVCLVLLGPVSAGPYGSRSRTKSSSPTFDQKQTGDYNIQLHLKDFQVVALLSEGALSDLGDYDYSYDYAELTVKPSTSTHKPTTPKDKPTTTQPHFTTTTQSPTTTTQVSSHKPALTNSVSSNTPTTSQPALTSSTQSSPTTTTHSSPTTVLPPSKITQKPDKQETVTKTTAKPSTTTEKRIHVEVVKDPKLDEVMPMKDENKIDVNVVAGKPNEVGSVNNKEESNQTDLLTPTTFRKCANGYTRDKQGRCRRVRRPVSQFPFGISRLATLASKLRQATSDGQTPNIE